MARVKIEGMSTFTNNLSALAKEATRINRGALAEAAGAVADAFKEGLQALPVCEEGYTPPGRKRTGATASEKSQIIDNFGIARFRDSGGTITTSIGFTGYVETPSTRFGGRVPTGYLMQAIEYGTEFRHPTGTMKSIERSVKGNLEKIVSDYIEKKTNEIMK